MTELMNFFFGDLLLGMPDNMVFIIQAVMSLAIIVSLSDIISIFVRWLFHGR